MLLLLLLLYLLLACSWREFVLLLYMELQFFHPVAAPSEMLGRPGGFPRWSGRARIGGGAWGGKAPGMDRCGNKGAVNGTYDTVVAAFAAIGDATPAVSAESGHGSATAAVATTMSQDLSALEQCMEAMWRHMGSIGESAVSRGDGGTRDEAWAKCSGVGRVVVEL